MTCSYTQAKGRKWSLSQAVKAYEAHTFTRQDLISDLGLQGWYDAQAVLGALGY
jgi:hypothetical protein